MFNFKNTKNKQGNFYISRFFDSLKLSKDFKLLCIYHLLVQVGKGMITLFLPIFLYQKFNLSIYLVILFYVAIYALTIVFVPIGAQFMNWFNVKKSMIIGRISIVIFYVCLYFFDYNPILFLSLGVMFLIFYKVIYWVPYHTTFVEFTDGKHRGRQLAWIRVLGYLGKVGAPLLAGIVLSGPGFNILFLLMIFIYLISVIPLLGLTEVKEHFSFSYGETFKVLFDKKNRGQIFSFMANGGQKLVKAVIWPIFIFMLLNQEYSAVGAVTALVIIGAIILQMVMGFQSDKKSKKSLVKLGASAYSLGWILKSFVKTAFQIFVVGTIHNFAFIMLKIPFSSQVYNFLSRHETYRDEYTAVRDIALNIGRIIMALLIVIGVHFFGLRAAFYLAAFASFLLNLF